MCTGENGGFLNTMTFAKVQGSVFRTYSQVQNERGGGGETFNFFVIFGGPPPQLILTPCLLISLVSRGATQKFINIS